MYKVITKEEFKKIKQYNWFKTFSNPCYGFNVKMDVTKVVEYSKRTSTSFFINALYLITIGLSSIEEMRIREVDDEIRLYDKINPIEKHTLCILKNFPLIVLSYLSSQLSNIFLMYEYISFVSFSISLPPTSKCTLFL